MVVWGRGGEASKGTSVAENNSRQNRSIPGFTVATVIYLPTSFVTVCPSRCGICSIRKLTVVLSISSVCGLLLVRDWNSIKNWITGRTQEETARLDLEFPY